MAMLALTTDFVFRVMVGVLGTGMIGVGIFSKNEFRWGRRGNGPRIEPQWVGRLFFAFIGSVMFYVAVAGFK
jgi:hypothetical protein